MVPSTQRILGFDGLRAVAFLLVFVSHKIPAPATERYGTAAVWLFFVLSGFLITRILQHSRLEAERRGRSRFSELLNFWKRRSLRIFPVYYGFLAVMSLLSLEGRADIGTTFRQISNIFFFANVYIETHGWIGGLGHLWSLSVEEQYYILFAPLALYCPLRRLGYLCAVILLISVVAQAVLVANRNWPISFDVNSFLNFGLMAIGGLAGLQTHRALPRLLAGNAAICLNFCAILVAPSLASSMPSWLEFGRLTGLPMALLLTQIYQKQDGWPVTLLNAWPLRRLGIISYGAYLFHGAIGIRGIPEAMSYSAQLPFFAVLIFDLAATIVLAEASWHLLEMPLCRTVRKNAAAARVR